MPLSIEKIGQISIRVRDIDRAIAFYRDTLGLRFLFQVPKLAFFDCGGTRILLDVPETAEFDHPSSVIYFSVSSIHDAFAELKGLGAETMQEPHIIAKLADREVWMAFFHDPDQNVMALMSEVPATQ